MLKLTHNPAAYSHDTHTIGGFSVHVYNAASLEKYVALHNVTPDEPLIPVRVLYLIHHRSGDYTYMEPIAFNLLNQLGAEKGVIAVTFDLRNHGERLVAETKNGSWREGNPSHALDMVSAIEGNVTDIKLVMDYLPAYLDLERFRNDAPFKFVNSLSGYSLGGHIVIRFAHRYPELVSAINPTIGCFDMTSLLVNRLKGTRDFDRKWFYSLYDELGLTNEQKRLYPQAFHNKVSAEDSSIFEEFPFSNVKVFACFYSQDPLVPPEISRVWVDMYLTSNPHSETFYEVGRVHDVTEGMIEAFGKWLLKLW